MSVEAATSIPLVNVQIDGVWKQFPKGTRLIEACGQAGRFIPRYCYHPKLSSPGNCRMCLVEMGMPRMGPDRKPELGPDGMPVINWIPRPQISCAQDIAEGMAVRTNSPLVEECRKGVMEFLLINHPLDCPICDQAGECRLQEFSVEYGNAGSRFLEEKVKKPKRVEIGPRITLDDERCILCTRCVRFMQEVAKDDCIGIVDRGSYSTITVHPDRELDSNYSLNTVDICPVGALTSSDFRFKMRVWFLKETKSLCTTCATGCNTIIGSRENVIYRQTPRENNEVNSSWMCDHGRLNFHYLNSNQRLTAPLVKRSGEPSSVTWSEAIGEAAAQLKSLAPREMAIIASGRMTNEELWLARKLAACLEVEEVDILPRSGEADGILVSADRNPNSAGAKLLGVAAKIPGSKLPRIVKGVKAGAVKALIMLGEDAVDCGFSEDDLKGLQSLVVVHILANATTALGTVVLPASGFAEKRGSMINGRGRLQRLNRAIQPPGEARDDWEILRDLVQAVAVGDGNHMIEDVFREMAAQVAEFSGLTLGKIGDLGIQLLNHEAEKSVEDGKGASRFLAKS